MEFPRLGVQLLAYTTATTMPDPSLGLRPTPTTLDPQLTEQGQGSNLYRHGYLSDLFPVHHNGNSLEYISRKSEVNSCGSCHVIH